jgi:hypothetical protein
VGYGIGDIGYRIWVVGCWLGIRGGWVEVFLAPDPWPLAFRLRQGYGGQVDLWISIRIPIAISISKGWVWSNDFRAYRTVRLYLREGHGLAVGSWFLTPDS